MAIKKQSIVNGRFTNFTNGILRVTTICENMTQAKPEDNHDLAIFSSIFSIPDTGISLPFDTTLGRNREINDIFNTAGDFAGSTSGNAQLIDKTQSITFAMDYVYLAKESANAAFSKNTLYSMLAADAFTNTDYSKAEKAPESRIWKVAGTNGNVKRGTEATSDLGHRWLLWEDGKLIIPQASENDGTPKLQENTRVTAYNKGTLCVMLEHLIEFSATYCEGYRFAYCSAGNLMFNEADDYNKISTDIQFLCDYRAVSNFFIDGPSDGEQKYAVTLSDKVKITDVWDKEHGKMKLYVEGNAPADSTDRIIKAESNVVRVYYKDSVNGNGYFVLKKECRGQVDSAETPQNGFVWEPVLMSLNPDGNTNTAINGEDTKVDFVKSYCLPIWNFDFEESKFVPYGVDKKVSTNCPKEGHASVALRVASFVPKSVDKK